MEKQKIKAMAAKQYKVKGGIILSSKEEDECDIKDDTDLNQANDKYSLQL